MNAYLREISGADFTAKDFRTWAGTVLAAIALREFEEVIHQKEAKKNIVTAIEAVARMLGNTPAVCRKCYIHPLVLDAYLHGNTISTDQQRVQGRLAKHPSQVKPAGERGAQTFADQVSRDKTPGIEARTAAPEVSNFASTRALMPFRDTRRSLLGRRLNIGQAERASSELGGASSRTLRVGPPRPSRCASAMASNGA